MSTHELIIETFNASRKARRADARARKLAEKQTRTPAQQFEHRVRLFKALSTGFLAIALFSEAFHLSALVSIPAYLGHSAFWLWAE